MKKIFIFLAIISAFIVSSCATIAQTYNDDVYYKPAPDTQYIADQPIEDNDIDIYINIIDPTPKYVFRPYYYDITSNWTYTQYPFYYSYFWYKPYVWYNYDPYYWNYYRWNNYYWGYNQHNHWYHKKHYHGHDNHYGHDNSYKYGFNDYSKYIGHRNSLTGNNRIGNSRNIYSNNKTIKQRAPQSYSPNENNNRRSSNEYISPKYQHRNSEILNGRNLVKPKENPTGRHTVNPTRPMRTNPNIYSEPKREKPTINPNDRLRVRKDVPTNNYNPSRREEPKNRIVTQPSRTESNNYYKTEPKRETPNINYNRPDQRVKTTTRSNSYSAPKSNPSRSYTPSKMSSRNSSVSSNRSSNSRR